MTSARVVPGTEGATQFDLCGSGRLCWVNASGGVQCAKMDYESDRGLLRTTGQRDVPGVEKVEELACISSYEACARSESQVVSCWKTGEEAKATVVATGIAKLAQGCGIAADGTVKCWAGPGTSTSGDTMNNRPSWENPVTLPGVHDAIDLVAERSDGGHACILHADQSVSCWGANELAQIGDGRGGGAVWAVPVVE